MNFKNLKKKAVPMLLVGGMLVGTGAFTANSTYVAEADKTQTAPSNQTVEQIKNFQPSQEAMDFMSKVVKSGAINEFNYSSDFKTMSYKHDMDTIKSTYNFNDEDIAKLDQIVKAYNESQKNGVSALTGLTGNSVNINQLTKGGPNYVDVDYGWTWIKMTFTNEEMKMMLVEAAYGRSICIIWLLCWIICYYKFTCRWRNYGSFRCTRSS